MSLLCWNRQKAFGSNCNFPLCVGQRGKQGPDQKRLCSYGVALECYVNELLLKDFELCVGKCLKRYRYTLNGLPLWLSGKESACQAGDTGLILESGRSPGEGDGNPLQ